MGYDLYGTTVLPLHMAKRMVENLGGEATENNGYLEIRRNSQLMRSPPIVDECVNYMAICAAFVAR